MYTKERSPGRYEGNRSHLVARIVEDVVLNGFADDETGDANDYGSHLALVNTRVGRYAYLLETDSRGFVTVSRHPASTARVLFEQAETDYAEWHGEGEGI